MTPLDYLVSTADPVPPRQHEGSIVDGHRVHHQRRSHQLVLEHPPSCFNHPSARTVRRLPSYQELEEGPADVAESRSLFRSPGEASHPACAWASASAPIAEYYRGSSNPRRLIPPGQARLIRWSFRYRPHSSGSAPPVYDCWWELAEGSLTPAVSLPERPSLLRRLFKGA